MVVSIGSIDILEPRNIIWIIPLAIGILIIARINFVSHYDLGMDQIKKGRRWVVISRILIALLLVASLMNPTVLSRQQSESVPRIELLIDNSTSMQVFDTEFVKELSEKLSNEIPTEIKYIAEGTESEIGNKIISSLEKDKNLLLVSDGWVTKGASIGDVFQSSADLEASISLIGLEPKNPDIAVSVEGPEKTVIGAENQFLIDASGVLVKEYDVSVIIDGITVLDERKSESSFVYTHTFDTEGYHTVKVIVYPIGVTDHFPQNNIFFKTVKVVEKPRVLYLSERPDPLVIVLEKLYSIDEAVSLPSDLSEYHAVVINDMPSGSFSPASIEKLKDFVADGNGLFVVGGGNSFEYGDYQNSLLETLLPVKIGTGEKKLGQANIVFVIDISGSASQKIGEYTVIDVEKALVVNMINDLSLNQIVGAIAFDDQAHLVHNLETLHTGKDEMVDKISRLKSGLGTSISNGLKGAGQLLETRSGSKNIIIFSDGASQNDRDGQMQSIAKILHERGITIYAVGINVDADNKQLMKELALIGGGAYLEADQRNVVKALFGTSSDTPEGDKFGLVVIDANHFITSEIHANPTFDAYNQVLPKESAKTLILTDGGNPALTVWNYGVGRVATFTAYAAQGNLGTLLSKDNSKIISRINNWAIGDPERKSDYSVTVRDIQIGDNAKIIVKSQSFPKAEGIEFVQIADNLYSSSAKPEKIGFSTVVGATYAVNYEKEFEQIGRNPVLTEKAVDSGGKIFKPEEIDKIIEHVKTRSTKPIVKETSLQWPLLLIALIIFLIDVLIRRMVNWAE